MKEVCWEDPCKIVEMSQDVYGTRRVLKGFYPSSMYGLFVDMLHVPLYPTTSEYLNAVYNLVNRTILPDREASKQLFTMFHVLGQKTLVKEKVEEFKTWGVPDDPRERCALYHAMDSFIDPEMVEILRSGQNAETRILPTHSHHFKTINDRPILSINTNIRSIYEKEEKIAIVSLDDVSHAFRLITECAPHLRRAKEREIENILLYIMLFYRACGLELLSDLHSEPEIHATPTYTGCFFWQLLLSNITSAVQRFIVKMFPMHYQQLQSENFQDTLKSNLEFQVANQLEMVYTLKGRKDISVKQTKLCIVEHSESLDESSDDPGRHKKCVVYIWDMLVSGQQFAEQIIKELMGVFVGDDDDKKEMLTEFVLTYTTVQNKEAFMRRKKIPKLKKSETVWEYPKPKRPGDDRTREKDSSENEQNPSQNTADIVESNNNQHSEELQDAEPPRKRAKNAYNDNAETTILPHNSQSEHTKNILAINLTGEEPTPPISMLDNRGNIDQLPPPPLPPSPPLPPELPGGADQQTTGEKRKHDVIDVDSLQQISNETINNNVKSERPTDPRLNKKTSEWFLDYSNAQQNTNMDLTPSVELRHCPPQITPYNVDISEQYEDLPMEANKLIDQSGISLNRLLRAKDLDGNIGQLGEKIVYSHLCREYKDELSNGLVEIEWLNESKEHWLPYDMKLTFFDQRQPPIVYIEVKATYLDEKKEFEISSNQIKFAFEQGERYHLYRLSGLRNVQELKLKRLANLGLYLENKSVKLFMIL